MVSVVARRSFGRVVHEVVAITGLMPVELGVMVAEYCRKDDRMLFSRCSTGGESEFELWSGMACSGAPLEKFEVGGLSDRLIDIVFIPASFYTESLTKAPQPYALDGFGLVLAPADLMMPRELCVIVDLSGLPVPQVRRGLFSIAQVKTTYNAHGVRRLPNTKVVRNGWPNTMVVLSNGRLLVEGDSSLIVLTVAPRGYTKISGMMQCQRPHLSCAVVSEDGRRLAFFDVDVLRVWSLDTFQCLTELHFEYPVVSYHGGVCFHSTGIPELFSATVYDREDLTRRPFTDVRLLRIHGFETPKDSKSPVSIQELDRDFSFVQWFQDTSIAAAFDDHRIIVPRPAALACRRVSVEDQQASGMQYLSVWDVEQNVLNHVTISEDIDDGTIADVRAWWDPSTDDVNLAILKWFDEAAGYWFYRIPKPIDSSGELRLPKTLPQPSAICMLPDLVTVQFADQPNTPNVRLRI